MTPDSISATVALNFPAATGVLDATKEVIPYLKRAIAPYQGMALFALAQQYNVEGARILEIGTAIGYSAAIMAQAAPQAEIITLNPLAHEVDQAQRNLKQFPNVKVLQKLSWDYHEGYRGPHWDMIFVDGDHKRVVRDLVWWDWLSPGGLMLFHDYSPDGTYRPCPPVYEAVNDFAVTLGRPPDVLVVDDGLVGMAGFYYE